MPRAIPWLKPLLETPRALDAWLDRQWPRLQAAGFWSAGNWLMDVGVLLDTVYRFGGDDNAGEARGRLLAYLSQRIDPATGFWFGHDDDHRTAMAGAMHLYPLYWCRGRQVPSFRQTAVHHRLVRTKAERDLRNLVYNLDRYAQLVEA